MFQNSNKKCSKAYKTREAPLNSLYDLRSVKNESKNLHPRVRVDQAVRPLPPKTLSILVGLVLKLISMCNHNL